MRLRTTLLILLAVQLILVAVLIALAVSMRQTQVLAEHAEERRYHSYQLADQLRQSSDDLTRFARTYVATGDPRFEQHFRSVLDIRNGEAPMPDGYEGIYWDLIVGGSPTPEFHTPPQSLRSRMLEAGFTNEEFNKLTEAQNNSDALVRLEDVAMHAVKGRFDRAAPAYGRM